MELDIVTVFCRRDLHQMVLQARSIRLFFDENELGQVVFVCNEPSEAFRHDELNQIADELANAVFIHSEDLLTRDFICPSKLVQRPDVGWYTQQVLKLLASRLVKSESYLILDAKNHFVRPVSRGDFVADDGRALAAFQPPSRMKKDFRRVWRNCLCFVGLDPDRYAGDVIPPTTPFLVRKDLACELIEYVEGRDVAPFPDIMLSRMPDLYEFLLLQAFAVYRHGGLDRLYRNSPGRFQTLFQNAVTDEDAFGAAMDRAGGDSIIAFGIHRTVDPLLSLEQRQRIASYWQFRGLVGSPQEGFRMMGWETGA